MNLLNLESKDICAAACHRVERFILTLVLPPLAAGVVLHAPAALAQQSSAEGGQVIEEVVVTGIRRSIIDAIALKRSADQITDAISRRGHRPFARRERGRVAAADQRRPIAATQWRRCRCRRAWLDRESARTGRLHGRQSDRPKLGAG